MDNFKKATRNEYDIYVKELAKTGEYRCMGEDKTLSMYKTSTSDTQLHSVVVSADNPEKVMAYSKSVKTDSGISRIIEWFIRVEE